MFFSMDRSGRPREKSRSSGNASPVRSPGARVPSDPVASLVLYPLLTLVALVYHAFVTGSRLCHATRQRLARRTRTSARASAGRSDTGAAQDGVVPLAS
jgi:hypothetical protein